MFINTIKLNSKINLLPTMMEELNKEGIKSIRDLVELYPSKYQNYAVTDLVEGYCLVKGNIISNVTSLKHRGNLSSLSFSMNINNENIKVIIFNRGFLKKRLSPNSIIYVEGKFEQRKKILTATNIYFKLSEGEITPFYSSNVSSNILNRSIMQALERYQEYISDEIPPFIIKKYQLLSYYEALIKIHNPQTMEDVNEARRRLKYEEFFKFQLKLQYSKFLNQRDYKTPKKWDVSKIRDFISTIPFELTDDQKSVVNDIFRDFKASYPANRLIQGDVGSGKTIVAAISLYAVVLDSYQVAFMAPTEILAIQHYENLAKLFANTDIHISLLTGSLTGKKKEELYSNIKNGNINVVVGTHALITDNIMYHNLGLVIVDEQHRFGVNQRQSLRKKGNNPDVLYLTATPIPRTLAIGLFGDMDISTIKTMPSGRQIIKTKYVSDDMLEPVLEFIKKEIDNGNQAYIIAPLVNESDKTDLHDISSVYEYVNDYFSNYNVGIIHGKSADKKEIMDDFKNNKLQILVATTVIEVGVDNKNATVILVLDAERFGLSQLHQLRGRVGRNDKKGYCFLVSTKEDVERLKIIEKTMDGFQLSEEDLKLRGPGDFFGSKQSGMPKFKIGDIIKDFNILNLSKNDAQFIMEQDLLKRYRFLEEYLHEELDKSSIID